MMITRCLRWIVPPRKFLVAIMLAVVLIMITTGVVCAADADSASTANAGGDDSSMGLSPLAFFLVILGLCTVIGMLAVLGGVGGGVIFTPPVHGIHPNRFLYHPSDWIVCGHVRSAGCSSSVFT